MSSLNKENLFHSYLIEGDYTDINQEIISWLKNLGITDENNLNIINQNYTTFSIEDGRDLKKNQQEKSFDDQKKIFIIGALSFGLEAQNALLKIFEEPTKDTHFFIIVPTKNILIPTLLSRMIILDIFENKTEQNLEEKEALKFLKSSKSERLKIISALIKEYEDEKTLLRDKLSKILNQIEKILFEKKDKVFTSTEDQIFVFEEIQKTHSFLNFKGSSVKILFETLALILPVI